MGSVTQLQYQHQAQEIDTGTMCVQLRVILAYVQMHKQHCTQDRINPWRQRSLLCPHIVILSPTTFNPRDHSTVLCLYNVVILGMLHKWNHILFDLLRFFFHSALDIHPLCCMYQSLMPSYCWVVFHSRDVPVCWTTCLMKDLTVLSSVGPLWTFIKNVCAHKFSALWDKCPEV